MIYLMFVAVSTDIVKTKAVLRWKWTSTDFASYRRSTSHWQNSSQCQCSWRWLYDFGWTQGVWNWWNI